MTSPRTPRPVDHCVLPVADLAQARARLEALGFTVAPDGQHPFGTENACIYFADGTFVEPLAIAQRETANEAVLQGNAFVARDAAFRFRRGEEGFSALVMGTQDAKGDHLHFVKCAMSGGKMLAFSRQFDMPGGGSDKASFHLAFAADLRAPDAHFFTCERVNVPNVDRGTLQRHENGVTGIREIVLSETNPTDFQYFLQELVNQRDVNAHSFGMDIAAANGKITVLNPAGMQAFFGVKASTHSRGLRCRAIVFGVSGIDHIRQRFEQADIAFREMNGRIVVPPAPGQGAIFAFEATR